MKRLRTGVALLFLLIGCGGSDNSAGADLNPPPNIDVVSCFDIVSSGGTILECADCCTRHGFPASNTYQKHCICGDRHDDSGDSVCAAQKADLDLCIACCADGNFTGHAWTAEISGSGGSCTCNGRREGAACPGPLTSSAEATACQVCCINAGYISWGYLGSGTPVCECLDY